MKNIFSMAWIEAALMRALHTFAQTAIAMITVGSMFSEINWVQIVSVSGVAALVSILKSIVAGTPESTTDGEVIITDNSDSTAYQFAFNNIDPGKLQTGNTLKIKVNNKLADDLTRK